jgi:hypothetical protein
MNPQTPKIRALMKLHKPDNPVRPTINWRNAPAYNMAKHLNKLITESTRLPNSFNVYNTNSLIKA